MPSADSGRQCPAASPHEEDAAGDGRAQAVRDGPAVLARRRAELLALAHDAHRRLQRDALEGADAAAGVVAGGEVPAVAAAHDVAVDDEVEAGDVAGVGIDDVLLGAEREPAGRRRERAGGVEHAAPARRVDDEACAERAPVAQADGAGVGARRRRLQQRHVGLRRHDAAERGVVEGAERLGQVEPVAAPADLHAEVVVLLADRVLGCSQEAQRPHRRRARGGLALAERATVDQHRVGAGQLRARRRGAAKDAPTTTQPCSGSGGAGTGRNPTDPTRRRAPSCADDDASARPRRPARRARGTTSCRSGASSGARAVAPRPSAPRRRALEDARPGPPARASSCAPRGRGRLRPLRHVLHAGAHGRVAGVQVERGAGLGDEVRALRLQVEQQAREVVVDESRRQQVAVLRRHRRQRRERAAWAAFQARTSSVGPTSIAGQGRRASSSRCSLAPIDVVATAPGAGRGRRGAWRGRAAGVSRSARAQRLQHLARRPRGAALLDERRATRR